MTKRLRPASSSPRAWKPWVALLAGALSGLSGCSSRPGGPAPAVDPWPAMRAAADAEAAEGCYRCLERALAAYESGLTRGEVGVGPVAYRTSVQLAVRERLLGLYPGSHQSAPARLAPQGAPADVAAADDALSAIAWRRGTLGIGAGMPLALADLPRLRERRIALDTVADTDAWAATLLLAMVGTNPVIGLNEGQVPPRGAQPGLDRDTWWRRHPDDATLSFTRLTLLRGTLDDLRGFQAAHTSFDEIDAIVGEAELAGGRLVSADEALGRALTAFPSLVPALVLRGDLRQRMEDFALALTLYDALLTRLPEHREALLGRLKSLGFLGRHDEAVTTADRLLHLGTWYMGEAHYWKAWNLFSLSRLDQSRASVDAARTLMVNADVHYLGGAIAFRQQRLDEAERDFDAAVDLENRHCEAHFDRAAIHLTRRLWPRAAAGFDEAFECLAARTPTIEQRIADARLARLEAEVRAALVARREQVLRDHRIQLAWARYNGGVAYANAGTPATARERASAAIAIGGPAGEAAQRLLPQLPPQM